MKDCSESELRMARGMEFQRVGAAMAKALSPMVRYLVLVMGMRVLATVERVRCGSMGRWRRSVRYMRGQGCLGLCRW